ncbi:MAG: YdjY domain-containing protein [Verrucomicrobiota bacterium]
MNFPLSAALLLACAVTLRSQEPPASPPKPAVPAPPASASGTPSGGAAPDPAKAIKRLDGSRYELNGIVFDKKTRAITLPAKLNMTDGLLEYALVHESGKVHESLLSTAVSPFDLNIVLLLLNYEAGTGFFDVSDKAAGAVPVKDPQIAPASQVNVTLDWKAADGASKSARLETLLLNLDKKATVTDGPFTYTGSMVMDDGAFMAMDTGSILALYVDAAALINNPREGNGNDDIWIPDKTKIPEKDTAVTVTLLPSAAKPAEKPAAKGKSKSKPKPAAKPPVKK